MGLFQVVCTCLLAVVARTQVLPNCSVDTTPVTVASTEDAAILATSLQCSNGDFAVQWIGEVFVEETIFVTGGTSLNVTGAEPGAVVDGGGSTQLFYVDEGSSLHLSDMTMSNGNTTGDGGAIYANQSTVSFSGNMSFVSNSAGDDGGAIYAYISTVSWVGDGTLFISNSAGGDDGGAIFSYSSTVSWDGDGTKFISNSAKSSGGTIFSYNSTVSWVGDGTEFISNSAEFNGGAIYSYSSTVSWVGDDTQFSSNSAEGNGGAIHSYRSTVSWVGDDTQFSSNSANSLGGAISALNESTVCWDGDGTQFGYNSAGAGGAIRTQEYSKVCWNGDSTHFSSNSASGEGGALYVAYNSNASWDGDGTQFSSNSAYQGGAISARSDSTVSWDGDSTHFSSNSAEQGGGGAVLAWSDSTVSWHGDSTTFAFNFADDGGGAFNLYSTPLSWTGHGTQFTSNFAGEDGGAISAKATSTVSWDGDDTLFSSNFANSSGGAIFGAFSDVFWNGTTRNTTFSRNGAGLNGGALSLYEKQYSNVIHMEGGVFIENSAEVFGGALHTDAVQYVEFSNLTFESNWAGESGGAIAAYATGSEFVPATFSRCNFSGNAAGNAGGAVDTLSGQQDFFSCSFERNSADVGGAMRLGGTESVGDCSFSFNEASTQGTAIAMIKPAKIYNSSFARNELNCVAGSYREDSEEEGTTMRFESECFDCPGWDECYGCTIERGDVTSTCEALLEHTTANESGTTIETLEIDGGYWRATTTSAIILMCYNGDACTGGETGMDSFCASGYQGPYCAVCESGYSPTLGHICTRCSSSRRHGLVAAAVIAALVAVVAVATVFKFLLSTEVEEGNIGCFRRRVLRAVPVQALKIIVVVWQILTQFADAANVTYPGVYQDFLSAIDVVNFDLGSVLAAGCLWSGVDFHGRLLVSTIGPLVVVGFLAMTYRIAVRRNVASSESAVEKIRHKHQTALLLLTFLVYSSVSSMVFQTFACETLDDGIEYLRADYRIHCTDDKHKAFEVYAAFMIFVYPLGIPLLYSVLLFQRRDVLADANADKTVAEPIAGLWEAYRPERFYYEVIECGRRILLTGVVVFIFPNTAAQIAITMLIAFFFFAVFDVLSPYTSESDTWLSRGGHVIVFLSMFDLLLLKVDVSGERDQSQAAFAGVLVAGHVLMILAIVVEVVGVCYASRKKKIVEGGEEASERPRVGSDDVPVFESAPASWRSFFRQRSVSEKTGSTRSISGNLVTTGGP